MHTDNKVLCVGLGPVAYGQSQRALMIFRFNLDGLSIHGDNIDGGWILWHNGQTLIGPGDQLVELDLRALNFF